MALEQSCSKTKTKISRKARKAYMKLVQVNFYNSPYKQYVPIKKGKQNDKSIRKARSK